VVVASAIVAFVFLNAALLGYLPFIERRPTAPLRPLRQAAATAPAPEQSLVTPPVIASAPAMRPPEVPAEPPSAPPTARIAPIPTPAPTATALRTTTPSVGAPSSSPPRPLARGPATSEAAATRAPRTPTSASTPPSRVESATHAPVVAAAAGGTFAVQVGAFKTDALADGALDRAIAAAPASGAALARKHEPVEKDGGTLYRAVLSGFPTSKQAGQFCTRLKSAGMACIIKR
jgi:cell division protein FtsN